MSLQKYSLQASSSVDDISKHNRTVRNHLKRGDLIEFQRGPYSHWAVYVGDGDVVHLTGDDNDGLNANSGPQHLFAISGAMFDKAEVCRDKLEEVIAGSKMFINNQKDNKWKAFDPDMIVRNALSQIGSVGYNVFTKNCEHFAKYCRYGKHISDQVDDTLTGLAIGGAVVAAVGFIAAWATSGKRKEDESRQRVRR